MIIILKIINLIYFINKDYLKKDFFPFLLKNFLKNKRKNHEE